MLKIGDHLKETLLNTIDMHIHTYPDVEPRLLDDIEVARQASKAGMRAIVFKNHHTITSDRAYLVNRMVPGIEVFGGIVLNYAVGGINPTAVDAAIKLGAKVVWMSSIDSKHTIEKAKKIPWLKELLPAKKTRGGISIVRSGKLIPEMEEVINMISETNIILATSHLSPYESLLLIDEAKAAGVRKLMVTHPVLSLIGMSIQEQKELAKKGAFLNYCYATLTPMFDGQDPAKVAKMMKTVGAEHTIISSDLGQISNPSPVKGLRTFIDLMLSNGLCEKEIDLAARTNPAKLLDIPDKIEKNSDEN